MVRLPMLSIRAHIPTREATRSLPRELGSSIPHTDDPQSYAEISHVNLMRGTTFEKDSHQDRAAFHLNHKQTLYGDISQSENMDNEWCNKSCSLFCDDVT